MTTRPLRLFAVLVLALGACTFDEAALLDPGTRLVSADEGELRVLRYRDEPSAGDDWVDVLAPVDDVVVETGRFRQEDALDATEEDDADVRRLFEAAGPGRTVLVELNCVACRDGLPATAPAAELHVWDFVVDDDTSMHLGASAAVPDTTTNAEVGSHVVVVRTDADESAALVDFDEDVLALVGSHTADDGAALHVDVFVAVGPGATEIVYGTDGGGTVRYPVVVSA